MAGGFDGFDMAAEGSTKAWARRAQWARRAVVAGACRD
jgi:hypothetical protein